MPDVELLPCAECGMPCRAGEYHPFAACLMFKACRNSETVRANLAPLQAENERLRAEVELWRHKAAVHQYRRKRLAEALRDARDCAESHLGLLIADNMSDGVEQTKALITKIDVALAQEDHNG